MIRAILIALINRIAEIGDAALTAAFPSTPPELAEEARESMPEYMFREQLADDTLTAEYIEEWTA